MKKFELIFDTNPVRFGGGKPLYRIRALTSFNDVKEGDIGGFLEKEENLSMEGDAWVYDNACVYDNARVYDDARVSGEAEIFGDSRVCDYAQVSGNARISENACVCGGARISENACVYGNASVSGGGEVSGNACVYDDARVSGEAEIFGEARIYDNAHVSGDACVAGNAEVCSNANLSRNLDLVQINALNARATFYSCADHLHVEGVIHIGENVSVCRGTLQGIEEFILDQYGDVEASDSRKLHSISEGFLAILTIVKAHFGIDDD